MPPEFCVEPGELTVRDNDSGKSGENRKADRVSDPEAPPAFPVELPFEHPPDKHDGSEVDAEDENDHQHWRPLPYREETPELLPSVDYGDLRDDMD